MSKNYNQLSLEQRYQIGAYLKAGKTQKEIAQLVGVNASTICRELRRNTAQRGRKAGEYEATNAHRKTLARHKNKAKNYKFTPSVKQKVVHYLTHERWSPELISHCLLQRSISHETIYKWIWHCKHVNTRESRPYKNLYEYLRHGKRRRNRGLRYDNRGLLLNRVGIDQRPAIVKKRNRIGDIEVDLMMGAKHQGAILVMTDRATLHTRLKLLASKDSNEVYRGILSCLKRNKYKACTLTFDNDMAFCQHKAISTKLGIQTYFTRPYCSQDKGTVENRIGVIRRFLPKKTNFNFVTAKQVKQIEAKLNNRPVRKFNYLTPTIVLNKKIALIC